MPPIDRDDFDDDIADEHGLDDDLFEDDDEDIDAFDTVPCPNCGASIADEAQWCPHCGDWVVHRPPTTHGRRRLLYALVILAILPGLILLTTC